MYRLQPIQEEMIKRVGFRQTTDPRLPQLLTQLTQSESGIFVQDRHPLLNTNNLKQASENFDQWPYEAWADPAPGVYAAGEYVKHVNKIWVANVDTAVEPGQAPLDNWTEVNNFSQYLLRILMQASQQTLNKTFEHKALDRNTKTIFENIHLFDGSGNRFQQIVKQGRFVGFRVRLQKQKHLAILLRKLGTQFSAATNAFKLYVYHEGSEAPILTRNIDHTIPNTFQWFNIEDIVLPYVSEGQDSGGVFFIGYYEDDIAPAAQAIRRDDYRWDQAPCGVCGTTATDLAYFQKWSAFSAWTPVAVAAPYVQLPAGPDNIRPKFANFQANNVYDSNWGLNFHLTLKCDLTDFILENIELFDEAYANQVAYEFLNSFAYTLRDNGDAKQTRDKAGFEIQREDGSGISKKLEKSFKALDFNMSGFNSVCLPDSGKRGPRTGSLM